jgi:hypothetical protein
MCRSGLYSCGSGYDSVVRNFLTSLATVSLPMQLYISIEYPGWSLSEVSVEEIIYEVIF